MTVPDAISPVNEATPAEAAMRFRERVRQRLGTEDVLVFAVAGERFGVELRAVEEVLEAPAVQAVPEAPSGLLGMFPLRESLLPLYSTARALGAAAEAGGAALVMRVGARRVALAVGEVEEVVEVPLQELFDPPAGFNDDEVVAGLLWRDRVLVTVLDARALVAACVPSAEDGS